MMHGVIFGVSALLFIGQAPRHALGAPNIVLVLCDDLGYGDLGCYGGAIKTPHLDQLAAEGIRLTAWYSAAPVCSPARAGLLTGKTPARLGIHDWIPPGHEVCLPRHETTVAARLAELGYDTCILGKWHLNGKFNQPEQPQPGDFGFQYVFATQNRANPNHFRPTNFVRNGQPVGPAKGYSCDVVVDEALHWLAGRRDSKRPFLLYLPFHEPHEEVAAPAALIAQYAATAQLEVAMYRACVTHLDAAVGRLLRAIEVSGQASNTLVIFTSDNGPETAGRYPGAQRSHGSAGPLRGRKLHLYEGGIRVPGIARWLGRIPPCQVVDEPVSHVDIMPTLLSLATGKAVAAPACDGIDLAPRLLQGAAIQRSKPLVWNYENALGGAQWALRHGRWKLLASHPPAPALPKRDFHERARQGLRTAGLTHFELYDLLGDIGEQHNLADAEPARLRELKDLLHSARRSILVDVAQLELSGAQTNR